MLRTAVALACVLALGGCGGGEPEESEQTMGAPRRAAYTVAATKVVLYGDSTEDGGRVGTNNALILQWRYDKLGRDIQIWEEAVGGTTALHLLTGNDGQHGEPFDKTMAASEAQIVGFRYGINDRHDYSPETFRDVLSALVRIAESAGKVVILQTPSPVDLGPQGELTVRQNSIAVREIAAAHPGVVLCDHRRVGNQLGYINIDGVHPAAQDYRNRQAATLMGCIEEAVARLPP